MSSKHCPGAGPKRLIIFFPFLFFVCALPAGKSRSKESYPSAGLSLPLTLAVGEEEEIIIFEEGPGPGPPSAAEGEEEIIIPDEEQESPYPSRSLLRQPKVRAEGKFRYRGYWENEAAFDTRQDNAEEDMIDFRSKIFGSLTYEFSPQVRVDLSFLTYYWVLEGGNDRQQSDFDLYEGYLTAKAEKGNFKFYIGQMIVRWGMCDLFSPTNGINPINYRVFVDPDSEDLRIPLPLFKFDFLSEELKIEALYIPIFQSAILELAGSDLSLVQRREDELPNWGGVSVDTTFLSTLQQFKAQRLDYREERFLTGDAALRLSYDTAASRTELVYFTGREDIPVFLYQQDSDPNDLVVDSKFDMAFDRYEMYALAWQRKADRVTISLEYAYSPERSLTRALDTDHDGIIDRTRRVRRPWQAAALELDYLDPNKCFFKLGAQRITYFNAPPDIVFASGDAIYFLIFFRYLGLQNLYPELRLINIQTSANQWFLSPRISYKFWNQFQMTVGFNLFTGAGAASSSQSNQDFSPVTIISDNNQAFISLRWSF